MNSELFSTRFYLQHKSGRKLYPARMKDRQSGRLLFRVSKGGTGGNTKEAGRQVEEQEMVDLVINHGFALIASVISSECSKRRHQANEILCGKTAVKFLEDLKSLVSVHRKDNTDKFWSCRLCKGSQREFAFDPRTKTKLIVRLDIEPPKHPGITSAENVD